MNSLLDLSLLRQGLLSIPLLLNDDSSGFVKHAQTEYALVLEIALRLKFCAVDSFNSVKSILWIQDLVFIRKRGIGIA